MVKLTYQYRDMPRVHETICPRDAALRFVAWHMIAWSYIEAA